MLQLDYGDPRPIYEQIYSKMKELVVQGVLMPHHQLPSVRELAAFLAVNPNTIQKAYRELENQGYLYSVRGKGNFVAEDTELRRVRRREELKEELVTVVRRLRGQGISSEEVRVWAREGFGELPGEGGKDQ